MVTTPQNWVGATLAGGRYTIQRLLGQGGMAQVFLAWDKNIEAEVVIKTAHVAHFDAEAAERFRREIRSLLRLAHPHVVMVTDMGEHFGRPFAVMPYLSGGSLADRRTRTPGGYTPMPVGQVSQWLNHITSALDHIHLQGFVHRDVKPANILFDAHGHVFLSDFGVAKAIAAVQDSRDGLDLTNPGMILGTPKYVAPEVVLDGQCDEKSDQYSLAVTLYEVLCGKAPFDDATPSALLIKHTTQAPPAPRSINPTLPEAVSAVLLKGLSKAPHARYENCTALAKALARAAIPGASAGASSGATQVLARPQADDATLALNLADGSQVMLANVDEDDNDARWPPPLIDELPSLSSVETPGHGAPGATMPLRREGMNPLGAPPPRRRRGRWPVLLGLCLLAGGAIVAVLAVIKNTHPDQRPEIASSDEEDKPKNVVLELPVAELVDSFDDGQKSLFDGRKVHVAGAVSEIQRRADGSAVIVLKDIERSLTLPGPRVSCVGFAGDERLRGEVDVGERIVVLGRCDGLLTVDNAKFPALAGDVRLIECEITRLAAVPLKDYDALIDGATKALDYAEIDLADEQLQAAKKLAQYAYDKPREDEVQRLLDRLEADRKRLAAALPHLATGKTALNEKRFDVAVNEYQTASELAPGHQGIAARLRDAQYQKLIAAAKLALEKGDTTEAEKLVSDADRKQPGGEEATDLRNKIRQLKTTRLLVQASDQMSADDLDGALKSLNQALAENPDDDSIKTKRDGVLQKMAAEEIEAGNNAFKQTQYADAIRHFEMADGIWDSKTPEDQIARVRSAWSQEFKLKGQTAVEEQRFADAESAFLQATKVAPDDADAQDLLKEVRENREKLFNEYIDQAKDLIAKRRQIDAVEALKSAAKVKPGDDLLKELTDQITALERDPATLDVTGNWEDKQGGAFRLESDGSEVTVMALKSAMFRALHGTLRRNGKLLEGRVSAVFASDPARRSRDIDMSLTIQDSLSMKFRYEWILIGPTGMDRGRRFENSLWTRLPADVSVEVAKPEYDADGG